jgi:pimeloyl-ACP methyl ester carboxylesterase
MKWRLEMNNKVYYKREKVNGIEIFYREAGIRNVSVVILFHGFPSAGHMFRNLIPILAEKYHVIAPDYPGFGNSEIPDRNSFHYTFDHIAEIMEVFLTQLNICSFAMYVFDYGAPIGFRIAKRHPEWITGIISQNGNIYQEGLGNKWTERAEYWKHPTEELRIKYMVAFAPETIKNQYIRGTPKDSVAPDGYSLDIFYMSRKGMDEIQSDLIFDYQSNVRLYPEFQRYLRKYKPPVLCVWGKNDVSFIPEGAKAFKKDIPDAVIKFVDSGHFALESHADEIGNAILNFLDAEREK